MPDYRRAQIEGGCYFFTVVTAERRPILTRDDVRRALRSGIERVRERMPFAIDAWVLLPDHMHCIRTLPDGDRDFSKRWSMIKRLVSQQVCGAHGAPYRTASHRRRRESGFWQRRFWEHSIRDEEDFRRHVDYVHWNPVKHGLVNRVAEWPYSSFRRLVRDGVYPVGWGGDIRFDEGASLGEWQTERFGAHGAPYVRFTKWLATSMKPRIMKK